MNKKLIGFAGGAVAVVMMLVGVGSAYALSISTGGTGGVQVGSNNPNVSDGAQTAATTSATTSAVVNVGLSAQVQAGQVTTSSASDATIVNLEGDTNALIQTNADLATYDNMVIQARPAIKAVNVANDGSVVVTYSQPAKFLGIFPTSISGNVDVDAQGNTTVHLPWWSMFYAKDTASVQSSVATSVQQAGIDFSGSAQANAQTAPQNSARLVNAVTSAIQAQTSANANASASAGY